MRLFWEIDPRRLVTGLTEPAEITTIDLTARDIEPTQITVVERSAITSEFDEVELAAGEEIIFAGKASHAGGSRLWSAENFVHDSTNERYDADVELSTNELIAAVGTRSHLFVWGELTIRKAGRDYHSTSFRVRLENDIIRGTETPASTDPAVEWYIDAQGRPQVRVKDAEGATRWNSE